MAYYGYGGFPKYVPVAQRRANAQKKVDKLIKKGKVIVPVKPTGRKIATTFWGKGWCDHIESFSDFANRLPRGRTYVRNGSVCHLEINKGKVNAIVTGSHLYNVTITINTLPLKKWDTMKSACTGQIGSLLDLLKGDLSDGVMAVVSERKNGLFPQPNEIKLHCDCPDYATMCKHVAATLYGVGTRLDTDPKALFSLRGVDHEELIGVSTNVIDETLEKGTEQRVDDEDSLAELFGIDLGETPAAARSIAGIQKKPLQKNKAVVPLPPYYSGARLKKLRITLELTQKVMAQKLGISATTLSKYEKRGRKKVLFAHVGIQTAVNRLWRKANPDEK